MDYSNFRFHCDYCNKDLGGFGFSEFIKIYRETKERGKRGCFCDKKCYEKYVKQFEIIYKDKTMYKISDNEYVPYIGSLYYFKTAEDCYKRMCNNVLSMSLF